MKCSPTLFSLAITGLLAALTPCLRAEIVIPPPADQRVASTQLRVVPDRAGWTYKTGEHAKFKVTAFWDQQPLEQVAIKYRVGPEMIDVPEKTAVVTAEGLVIDGGTLNSPGFIRCVVTAEIEGRSYRGVATAGFSPEKITPTQANPTDFDAFWNSQKAMLAAIPLYPVLTLQPDLCTSKVDVFHLNLQSAGPYGNTTSRIYGILCVPKAEGKFPAVLNVPGAGVRPYRGLVEMAERGVITLQIGIHGIPVNLPADLYAGLGRGALNSYFTINLDQRDSYYYRRVYLGCVRSNDYLVSHPKWNGKQLIVMGGSQGGQLSIVTASLDPRVTALAANYPAYCDVTGYLHGRAGGWPHMMRGTPQGPSPHATDLKIATTAYYDAVNFARRLKVPGYYSWGYNDETCPPTSMFAAYNVIPSPKYLLLALEMPHATNPEQNARVDAWVLAQAGIR